MRPQLLILGFCALAVLTFGIVRYGSLSAADCGSCMPNRDTNIQMSGSYRVCFDANSFTQEQADKMTYGFQSYWTGEGKIAGLDFDSVVTFPDSSCDITVDAGVMGQPDWAAVAHETPNGHGAGWTVNINNLANHQGPDYYDYWAWLGAHEMGHDIGFLDVHGGGCAAYSIMYDTIVPPFPSSTLCSDTDRIEFYYGYDPLPCDTDPAWPGCGTPLIIDTKGNGFQFTTADKGVVFDIN